MITEAKSGVADIRRLLAAVAAGPTKVVSMTADHAEELADYLSDDELDHRVLIAASDPSWPEAVPQSMVANTPAEWKRRADVIVNSYMNRPVSGRKFLDFGCGNGMVAATAAAAGAAVSVGYDVVEDPAWAGTQMADKGFFTTDWDRVMQQAPYDSVLMFDVFDHMEKNTQIEHCLKAVAATARGGLIYFRGHPWSSRHGGHIYRKLNKAYVHMMLTPDLLAKLSEGEPPTTRMLYRIGYENFWRQHINGVGILAMEVFDTPVEPVITANPAWMNLMWDRAFKPTGAQDLLRPGMPEHLTTEFVDLVIRRY
jgi:hypothetical protein